MSATGEVDTPTQQATALPELQKIVGVVEQSRGQTRLRKHLIQFDAELLQQGLQRQRRCNTVVAAGHHMGCVGGTGRYGERGGH